VQIAKASSVPNGAMHLNIASFFGILVPALAAKRVTIRRQCNYLSNWVG
jgi:hypothetical protein